MDKYTIGEILDRETNIRSDKFKDIIGRKIEILLCEEGKRFVAQFINESEIIRTSLVQEIEETDYGLWITTNNRLYRLDLDCFYK